MKIELVIFLLCAIAAAVIDTFIQRPVVSILIATIGVLFLLLRTGQYFLGANQMSLNRVVAPFSLVVSVPFAFLFGHSAEYLAIKKGGELQDILAKSNENSYVHYSKICNSNTSNACGLVTYKIKMMQSGERGVLFVPQFFEKRILIDVASGVHSAPELENSN
jgi:hypothetical protein